MPTNHEKPLTISQTADVLGVHPNTLRNWIKRNWIPQPEIRLPSGYMRFTPDQVEQIKQQIHRKTEAQ